MMKRTPCIVAASAIAIAASGCHPTAEAAPAAVPTPAAVPAAVPSVSLAPPPFATPPVLTGTPDVATLVAAIKPSVVNVTVEHHASVPRLDLHDSFGFFGRFFDGGDRGRLEPLEPLPKQTGVGSGVIIDREGHVITNEHVVDGAEVVRLKLSDAREFKARVVGKDARLDVALLQIEGAKDLPAAALGSSEALRVGDQVVAIGNPFGLGHTVTMGIVSAKSRSIGAGPYDDFIQTDASINPGNSGGPLFNLRGEVVGINTAINPAGRGIGFAIPIDAIREELPQLLAKGHVERGRLGVRIQGVDEALAKALGLDRSRGALVAEVEADSPAARAALESGDVILAVDGARVESSQELPRLVARHPPGTRVELTVQRRGRERKIDVVLGALSEDEQASANKTNKETQGPPSPRLGVELADGDGKGARVERVVPGSPAAELLDPGDLVVEVDGVRVGNAKQAAQEIARAKRNKPLLLRIQRGDAARYVAVDVGDS